MLTTLLLLAAPQAPESLAVTDPETPREFGAVRWGRRLEPALDAARASSKPVLLLFQEVPG